MNNVKKVIMCVCVVMMVMGFRVSCSYSQDKPSEEVMKNIISQVIIPGFSKDIHTNIKFDTFQITHSFFKKGTDGRDKYCVEINYYISYTFQNPNYSQKMISNENKSGKVEKFSFLKKGDDWYGKKGWDIQ